MKKIFFPGTFFLILLLTFSIENCQAQWQPDVRLTNDSATSFTTDNNAWSIASNGNFVHVVWFDDRDGNYEIYYKRSTDCGISWGSDIRFTNNNSFQARPSISLFGQVVHVVWTDSRHGLAEIYYKRSTDGGVTWGADTRLTNNNASSYRPSLSVSGQNVHVVWYDNRDGNNEIYYKRSTNGGTNWGADTRLTNDSNYSGCPSISVSTSYIHVVWYDNRDGYYQIYYKRSTDGGVTWEQDVRLTNIYAVSDFPSVSVSGAAVHVVWVDTRTGFYDIFYKRSTDGGVTWEQDTPLTNDPGGSYSPVVAVSGQIVHVVWYDTRDGNNEIYYKRSLDEGISWEQDTRLTNNGAGSNEPSIAISDSVVHVVWYDFRDGNPEIYYKRNPTGSLVGITNINLQIPKEYSLLQNYPNPFNPSTNIKFNIAKSGKVKIIVYDVMGREVQTLVNETLIPGTYELIFNGSSLNSGVYFYKLVTDIYSETKRMVLVK